MSQNEKTSDFKTGAVRSADANHLDFTSLPLIGLIGVARTASEGGTKYGRYNYLQGMPIHDTLNHSIRHIFMYILGDRSEPHLEHAAWGLLASIQQQVLDPDVSAPHLLGPGATITPAVQAYLDANKDDLAARRKAGEFAGIGSWGIRDLQEIQTILKQRDEDESKEENAGTERPPWSEVVRAAIRSHAKKRSANAARANAIHQAVAKEGVSFPESAQAQAPGRLNRNPEILEASSKTRDTSGIEFDNAQGQAVAEDEEPYSDDTKVATRVFETKRSPHLGGRFRVEHPQNGETRIAKGVIWLDNKNARDQSPLWDKVLIYDRPEDQYALMSDEYRSHRTLAIQKADWDAGEPYLIDSAWGYATASAKSNKITGEVTRTEKIDPVTLLPEPKPVSDEAFVDFLTFSTNVRVYFKKQAGTPVDFSEDSRAPLRHTTGLIAGNTPPVAVHEYKSSVYDPCANGDNGR